ncbi:hypothetical protein [Shimia sediminis]|uniref:hypothetical protein n=1 Tax=Shimia sediminis TaxID=2497945 RepID=UPI000F8EA26D|nr:hypothetical protein [Shimia sediminis]
MQAPTDIYIDNETYTALRAELAHLITTPFVNDADTKVVEALGEIGGIWPKNVMDDAEISGNSQVSEVDISEAA